MLLVCSFDNKWDKQFIIYRIWDYNVRRIYEYDKRQL